MSFTKRQIGLIKAERSVDTYLQAVVIAAAIVSMFVNLAAPIAVGILALVAWMPYSITKKIIWSVFS